MPIEAKNIVNFDDGLKLIPASNTDALGNELKRWEAFKEGSEAAFVDLYNQYFTLLYNYGKQFSGDFEFIKDSIQETFITLRTKRQNLPVVKSVKAYLLKVARNRIINEIRDANRHRLLYIKTDSFNFNIVPSHENVLITRQFSDQQLGQIQRAVSQLPARQKEIIYHFYYSKLTYEEIKEIMGFKSVAAARNLMSRAIKKLRNTSS